MSFSRLACLSALLAMTATPAFAAAPQVFVSSRGADAATCGTPAAPCRTFQYAHDVAVTAGGVISVMDSGEYGPVRITKSVSIINNGAGVATIAAGAGQTAITINVPSAARIVLRGLTMDGAGLALSGLFVPQTSVGSLALDVSRCVFRNFARDGIAIAGAGRAIVSISDTESSDNRGGAGFGIFSAAVHDASVKRSRLNRNRFGVWFQSFSDPISLQTTFKNVEFIDNTTSIAIIADSSADPTRAAATLTGVSIVGSGVPLSTLGAGLRVSRSVLISRWTPEMGDFVTSSGDNQAALSDRTVAIPIIQMR